MSYKILLVDDDIENLKFNKLLLSTAGYQVMTATSGEEAIKNVKNAKKDFALILMDYHMPSMSGSEAVCEIKKLKPHQQILAFSLDDTREVMRENFIAGVVDFLDKNSENDVLLSAVAGYCEKFEKIYRTLDKSDLVAGEKELSIKELGMIGSSDKLYELTKQIRKVGPTQATVLIQGESGSGKELVARAIHQTSHRASGPYLAFNIAAESQSLIDSSLFGHKKGAFTGAVSDQLGKFRLAHSGTIFLDEIGDLSLDLQVKLLRVLQEKEITPIGATRASSVDVRIITATHKDLKKMVAEGTFREDLYYRLNSIIITTTPLRDRHEDIELLVAHFSEEICRENNFRTQFKKSCLDVFRNHYWQGNVRELRSVLQRHLIKSEGNIIGPEDLDASLYDKAPASVPVTLEQIDDHVERVKKGLVVDVMKSVGTKAAASRKLGISQNRLHYFLNKWGLGKV
ncbi:MAG: sigma-54 dependent transcriptional regulator [Pseudomonadota bacterium]|nr:sigma-54 dependent transcriptional regulator [Pseudomonadota bacterium]